MKNATLGIHCRAERVARCFSSQSDFRLMTASHPLPTVSMGLNIATAKLEAVPSGGDKVIKVGGDWRLNERVPSWNSVLQNHIAMILSGAMRFKTKESHAKFSMDTKGSKMRSKRNSLDSDP